MNSGAVEPNPYTREGAELLAAKDQEIERLKAKLERPERRYTIAHEDLLAEIERLKALLGKPWPVAYTAIVHIQDAKIARLKRENDELRGRDGKPT